jgi:hypothetical protein
LQGCDLATSLSLTLIPILPKQAGHIWGLCAFDRTELLPGDTVLADLIKRLVAIGKQVFSTKQLSARERISL